MKEFNPEELQKLYIPSTDSHKGQNGKLMIIGGSHLFHAASLWALTVASRIVDMVFYSSVPNNNEIVKKAKEEFRNGIVVERNSLEEYMHEADCILIGPGMMRESYNLTTPISEVTSLQDIKNLAKTEGEEAYYLTGYLLTKYPQKKWVIDAGALQMMDKEWIKNLNGNIVLTPHSNEFERTFLIPATAQNAQAMAQEYYCVIALKGQADIVCKRDECVQIQGGNAGMTKGGTGDVLAGLIAALCCKNDVFLAAKSGSYINKKAGESLEKKMGLYFNASDLALEIPSVMKELIQKK